MASGWLEAVAAFLVTISSFLMTIVVCRVTVCGRAWHIFIGVLVPVSAADMGRQSSISLR